MVASPRSDRKEQTQIFSTLRPRIFFLVTLISPLLIVLMLEILLRLVEYNGNLDLIVTKRVAGREVYAVNRSVARRYFSGTATTVPEPSEDMFEIQKSPRTRRIFCLGESTMAGFPFEFNATAPGFLRAQLSTLLPEYTIEIVNVGLSAVGSYVVKDFIDELVDYEPDLFVVYVGHNEFYGAFGAASTVRVAGAPRMTDLTLWLLQFKIFQAIRNAYVWTISRLSTAESGPSTMMEQMVLEQSIPYKSETYDRAREAYRKNIESMIRTAKENGAAILVCTLVSNLKDQPPFRSILTPTLSRIEKERWNSLVSHAESLAVKGEYEEAAQWYRSALLIDSLHAETHYNLGHALYGGMLYDEAHTSFLRAKDLDALRFRMSEEFQSDLLNICRTQNIPVARIDSSFSVSSSHGIVGNELILEHLHPTIEGYDLMAKTLSRSIVEWSLLSSAYPASRITVDEEEGAWGSSNEENDSVRLYNAGVTDFDRIVGMIRIDFLTRRWPFNQENNNRPFVPQNPMERIALRYVRGEIGWQAARYELAGFYMEQRRFDLARREAEAVSKVVPYSYEPLLRVADSYFMEGRKNEADKAYRKCIETEDNPYARSKLSLVLLERGDMAEAALHLRAAFSLDSSTQYKLPLTAAASNRYLLGFAYARLGQAKEATEELKRALKLNPNLFEARELLRQLNPEVQR